MGYLRLLLTDWLFGAKHDWPLEGGHADWLFELLLDLSD